MSNLSNRERIFLDMLVEHVDPHQSSATESLHKAQLMCGRWLTLRRLSLHLTSMQLASIVNVPVENIQLLEVGFGKADLIPDSGIQILSTIMAKKHEDSSWVQSAIKIALGYPEFLSDSVINHIIDQLGMFETPVSVPARGIDIQSLQAPAPESKSVPVEPFLIENEPSMFAILQLLTDQENYAFAIWRQLEKSSMQLALGKLASLLDDMLIYGLLEEVEKPLRDPAIDSEPIQLYKITPYGRQSFHVERRRRLLNQKEKTTDHLPELSADSVLPFMEE